MRLLSSVIDSRVSLFAPPGQLGRYAVSSNLNSNGYRGINTLVDLDNQPHQGYRLVFSQWPVVGVGFRLAIVNSQTSEFLVY